MTIARPPIQPRSTWAAGLPSPTLPAEAPGDVRFLLVHHTAGPNTDSRTAIPARLREIHRFHTTTRGWPDIAYNFLIDPYGRIWEGRTGSLTRPVKGSATGGSQGYALLSCFLGTFESELPTQAAMDAMAHLLAWLAQTYRVDLRPGAKARFTSRGSTRWPAGVTVTTDTIAGHRDMSTTTCPGSALYPRVRSHLAPTARALAGVGFGRPTPPVPTSLPRSSAPSARPSPSGMPPSASSPSLASPRGTSVTSASARAASPSDVGAGGGSESSRLPWLGGALATLGGGAMAWVLARRSRGGRPDRR